MKTHLLVLIAGLAGCGSALDGNWTGSAASGGLSFDYALKLAGANSDITVKVLAGGNLLLQTVSSGTYKKTGAQLEFTSTSQKASDAQGADIPVTKKQCATKNNCDGFAVSLGGMEDCQCAVNSYDFTQTGDSLTLKSFGGADVTFTRGK